MNIQNKTILITGGTGSLGYALTSRLLTNDNRIIIYSRDEGKQALLYGSNPKITKVIGDIRDYDKFYNTLCRYDIDYIIHAAALKRIDDMEFYPDECIKTNINGSDNVAKAAIKSDVKKCILVSTDKACQPINVYGASKLIAERTFTNYDFYSTSTKFSSIRYGNVIASRGSFIPLFMEWIDAGKTIKVTSEQMTRFLFTLSDAVDAVLNAVEYSVGGEVFVPQINSYTLPTCIKALEIIMGKNARTEIVGLRPGEKLHEDMLAETELQFTYSVPNCNLLQIRPQYTNRKYMYVDYQKYTGPHFNSALWVKTDIDDLINLINKGLQSETI